MTIAPLDSIELIKRKRNIVETEASERELLDQLIKEKKYREFFETIDTFDTTQKGVSSHIARKIRKLNFDDIVKDPELIAKLIQILASTHPKLIDKQVLQRGLINKLQRAINKENVLAQLVCLKLINTMKPDQLEDKLEKTRNKKTIELIRAYKSLFDEDTKFSINPDLTISVKPGATSTAKFVKVQQFLAEFKWSDIHLNLENEAEKEDDKLISEELKRLLMVIKKDSSPYISLKLKGHQLSTSLMKDVTELINTAPTIKELNLKNCQINHKTLKALIKIWDKKKDPLTKLNLAGNPLEGKGIKLLLGKIPPSTQLAELRLQSTKIDKNSLTDLCQHLNVRSTPVFIKLSESEVEDSDREFIEYMCTPSERIEFVKSEPAPIIEEVKQVESITQSSDESSKEQFYAKVYDGKTQTLRPATEKDLETFDAVFIPDREAIATEFVSEVLEENAGTTITVSCQGIPLENMRILIEENQLMILAYWSIYKDTTSGYKVFNEYYYEVLEYTGYRLKPETFLLDQIDNSTLQLTVESVK